MSIFDKFTSILDTTSGKSVAVNSDGSIKVSGSDGTRDAFSRLRIANPVTLFDTQNEYNNTPIWWNNKLTGGGTVTHLPNESTASLNVGTASGDEVIRQTKPFFRYQSGKSQFAAMTFVFNAAKTNLRQRVGYFETRNGIFLELNNTSLNIVRRTFTSGAPAVDTIVNQNSWNIDPMDGTGPSGKTLDITKAQILLIDLQWLGVGRVRVGFDIDGDIYYVHQFLNANNLSTVYMTTANLPVRYEITNTGITASSSAFKSICTTVISEGGTELDRIYQFSTNNPVAGASIGTTRTSVLSIRPKATFNGITNREMITFLDCYIIASGEDALWELVYNATLTGATWSDVNTTNSGVEFSTSNITNPAGIVIYQGLIAAATRSAIASFASAASGRSTKLPLTLDIDGANPIALSLVIRNLGVGVIDVNATMNWNETY